MSHTIVIDRGWDGLVARLKQAKNSFTKVGFPADGKTSGRHDMTEQIEIAVVHEFGSPDNNIPERSFMRTGMDQNLDKVNVMIKQQYDEVVVGTKTVRGALKHIGEEVVSMIKQKIIDGPFTKLSQRTIDKKKNDIPLIETHQMKDTIQHIEVINGK